MPDWRVVFTQPLAAAIALGASGEAGYAFSETWDVFLRAGAGLPVFIEGGEVIWRDTRFPLGLWPDLSLGAQFSMP